MSNKMKQLEICFQAFIKQVEHDLSFKMSLYDQYDEKRKTAAVIRFEHEAWLLCQTASERLSRQNARRQLQNLDLSKINAKLNHQVVPIFDKWAKETFLKRKSIQEEHLYAFYPKEKSNVQTLLKSLKEVIDRPQKPIVVRAATLCRNHVIQYLFSGIDSKLPSSSIINHFLKTQKLTLKAEEDDPPEWRKVERLKNKPGRRSVSSERLMRYIKHLINWFLHNPVKFHTVGQAVLVIWCAQSIAKFRRRFCSINDILRLDEMSLLIKSFQGSDLYSLKIPKKRDSVPISKTLYHMLTCLLDQCEPDSCIFSVDRSTIENHLKATSLELGYDPELFPVTPETFLERPIESGLDIE
ncbi:MAG: hypothetical protein FJZ63_06040 [Chlamydiae bacterium]|nr:hypothetical protein [Chlamydiota bacterium]